MTQIEQICAEIEHQLTICKKSVIESNKNGFPLNSSMHTGEVLAYTNMLDFINSLPQEPASEELEEAVEAHRKELDYWGMPCGYKDASCSGFKAGANWQLNKIRKEYEKNRN